MSTKPVVVAVRVGFPPIEYTNDRESWYPADWRKAIEGSSGVFVASSRNLRELADYIDRLSVGEEVKSTQDPSSGVAQTYRMAQPEKE